MTLQGIVITEMQIIKCFLHHGNLRRIRSHKGFSKLGPIAQELSFILWELVPLTAELIERHTSQRMKDFVLPSLLGVAQLVAP